jgi:hypothetical protein
MEYEKLAGLHNIALCAVLGYGPDVSILKTHKEIRSRTDEISKATIMFTQPWKQRNTSICENYQFHEYLLRHPTSKEIEIKTKTEMSRASKEEQAVMYRNFKSEDDTFLGAFNSHLKYVDFNQNTLNFWQTPFRF